MKLRQQPEDFIVEEIPAFTPDAGGRYFVYEITKRGLATFDVLDILRKALRIPSREVSASGLKDKHAVTTQLVSLPKPLPASFSHNAFEAHFVGKSSTPMRTTNIEGNRFRITARALQELDVENMLCNADELNQHGVPNYYDSQRFGGGNAGELPGREIIKRDYEEALRLHMAVPRRKQSMKDKRIRRECAKYWGDWAKLKEKLPRSRERSIVTYLADHPDDHRGALARVNDKLTTLYVAAYQSYLFNASLTALIRARFDDSALHEVKYKAGSMYFWKGLDEQLSTRWREGLMPLMAHATEMNEFDEDVQRACSEALEGEGLALSDLVVKGFDRLRLRPAKRPLVLLPKDLELSAAENDDLNDGRLKCVASFSLPRGSYATLIMKRLGCR